MAKGNDGNFLQHCIEVEAAVRLLQADPAGKLHVALTHGMAPLEPLDEPVHGVRRKLLCEALCNAAGEPHCNEGELVKAYRKCRASRHCYPNSAELLRTVVGADRLSGGITETCQVKHEKLAHAWRDTEIRVANSSWRRQLGRDGVLGCPDNLESPWLFSMDPMTFSQTGSSEDNLNRSDLDRLECALVEYSGSGQPGIACFFVYGMRGAGLNDSQREFWKFVDDLAGGLGMQPGYFRLPHQGGNGNLAGLLFSNCRLASGFEPPEIELAREAQGNSRGRHDSSPEDIESEMPEDKWSTWRSFPDPRKGGYLCAPFGPGVYELRNSSTGESVLSGSGKNLAYRMSSLLPKPHGAGARNNEEKRKHVLDYLGNYILG